MVKLVWCRPLWLALATAILAPLAAPLLPAQGPEPAATAPLLPPAAAPLIPIAHTPVPPVIDGRLDDACWTQASPVLAQYQRGQALPVTPAPMVARFAWDEHFLFIAYDLSDRHLVALDNGLPEGPVGQQRPSPLAWLPERQLDLAEVFVSFDDPNFFWELHHNAANQFGDVWCTVPEADWPLARSSSLMMGALLANREYLIHDRQHTLTYALQLKPRADGQPSTVNDPSDVDSGYTAELRIPWAALGAPAERREGGRWDHAAVRELGGEWRMAGQILRLVVVQLNGDVAPEPYYHSIPGNPPIKLFHTAARHWPRFQLQPPAPLANATAP